MAARLDCLGLWSCRRTVTVTGSSIIYVHRCKARPPGSELSRELPGRCINCEQSSLVTEIIVLIV